MLSAILFLIQMVSTACLVAVTLKLVKQRRHLVEYLTTASKMVEIMHESLACIAVDKNNLNPKKEAMDALIACGQYAGKSQARQRD